MSPSSSSSRLPRLPDPDKWVSANKVERAPPQRPLVDSRFRAHCGIATPPPSTSRKRGTASNRPSSSASASASTSKKRVPDVTPTAPQRSITSFFTPPTTGPTERIKAKGKGRTIANDASVDVDASPLVREAFALPSSLPPRSRRATPQRPLLDSEPASPPAPMTSEEVLVKHRRLFGQNDVRARPLSPWREMDENENEDEDDDVYSYAMPQSRQTGSPAIKRKRVQDHAHHVTGEWTDRTPKTKKRRALGEFKSLAHVSSSSSPRAGRESSPSERTVLGQKPLNVPGMSLRRHSSAIEGLVGERDAEWPKSRKAQLPAIPSGPRRKTPALSVSPQVTPRKNKSARHKSPRPKATAFISPQVTPRKRRSPHHKVTPPKSRTPQKYSDRQETLFVLPEPPPQPVFEPVAARPLTDWQPVEMEPETLMTWSMGGGYTLPPESPVPAPAEPEPEQNDVEFDDSESIAGSVASQSFPHLVESASPRRIAPQGASPTNALLNLEPEPSLSPRSPSQNPFQLPLSPEAPPKQPSNDTIPSSIPEEPESDLPASSPPPSPSPRKLVRRADQGFKRHGLFSSISDAPPPHPPASGAKSRSTSTSTRSSQSRVTRSAAAKKRQSQQSKLESFGYMPRRRETADFATPFSDEEDLDFGESEEEDELPLFGSPVHKGKRLGPVPEAPPHPSLRPAGVREMARREAEAMGRHRQQSNRSQSSDLSHASHESRRGESLAASDYEIPHLSSEWALPPSTSASSLDGLDAPRLSVSTKEWWDRLGERDTSPSL